MSDQNAAFFDRLRYHLHQPEETKRLSAELRQAEAEMAYRFANLQMPEDIRGRARAWGMEAFCEVLWNNAFQAGFREALRGNGELVQKLHKSDAQEGGGDG